MRRLTLLFFLLAAPAIAADVELTWTHSPSAGVTGYRVYWGQASRTYTQHRDEPYVTTATVPNLGPGTYYFAVAAYNATAESPYSNEVSEVIRPSCDLNGDANVNMLDLQAFVSALVNSRPLPAVHDLNRDGRTDVLDLQILANVILGNRTCPQ